MKIRDLIARLQAADPDLDASATVQHTFYLEGDELAACYDERGNLKRHVMCSRHDGRPVAYRAVV